MRCMGAKELLEQIKNLDYKIKLLTERIEELERMLQPGIEYNKIGGAPRESYHPDTRVNIIYKLSDTKEDLIERRAELFAIKSQLTKAISLMDNRAHMEILVRRYFYNQQWSEIAKEMKYNIRWCFRLHEQAIAELDKILNKPPTSHMDR